MANDIQTLKNRDGSIHEFTTNVFVRQPNPVPEEVATENAKQGLLAAAQSLVDELNNSPIAGPTLSLVDAVVDDMSHVAFETHTDAFGVSHSQAKGSATGHALVNGL
jgi:hypothetical protein